MENTIIFNLTDDAYFYKFAEQDRMNQILNEMKLNIDSYFDKQPYAYITDVAYYLRRSEHKYDYVATVTYNTTDFKAEDKTLVLD